MSVESQIKSLPKIELHAHLNGSLSKKTFQKLSANQNNNKFKEYSKLYDILNNDLKSLEECFKIFGFAHDLTNTPEAVYEATKDVVEEFFQENVIYLELRTTPRCEKEMNTKDYIKAVIKAIESSQSKYSIRVKLILSINREHNIEISKKNLDIILEMRELHRNIIKGIDLCGNPNKGNFKDLEFLFKKARNADLFITLHCGEVLNNEEVQSILKFHPNRIGHATFLHPTFGGDEENLKLLQKYQILTECCLTSNVICGTVKSYQTHHVTKWIEEKLPFCLCTDDKGVFNSNLSSEYIVAYKYLGLSIGELWQISYNSIDFSFASDSEKNELKQHLLKWKEDNLI